jgi:putative tryptophan/tyrosine transport system substrate-binding protein
MHLNRRATLRMGGLLALSAAGITALGGCGLMQGQSAPAKMVRIGILGVSPGTAGPRSDPLWAAFLSALEEDGWIEGQNLALNWRFLNDARIGISAEGEVVTRGDVVDMVAQPVDVIVTQSPVAANIAKQATTVIPIVVLIDDPVGRGLAESIAHPGGNLTGIAGRVAGLSFVKVLELLHQLVPGAQRVAFVYAATSGALHAAGNQ